MEIPVWQQSILGIHNEFISGYQTPVSAALRGDNEDLDHVGVFLSIKIHPCQLKADAKLQCCPISWRSELIQRMPATEKPVTATGSSPRNN